MSWVEISVGVLVTIGALVLTAAATLLIVARLPEDYFVNPKRQFLTYGGHPAVRIVLLILKNLAGVIFMIAGILLAIPGIPGQGFLTFLIGVMLVDFPGKYRLERWLIRRRIAARLINWLRSKSRRPPLQLPGDSGSPPSAP